MKFRSLVPLVLLGALALGGCTTTAQVAANVAQSLSSSTPSQVTTLAEAQLGATTFTKLSDAAVNSGKLSRDQLNTVNDISEKVHKALTDLETANANGQSLTFAAINESLNLWRSYATSQGIAH
jgi:PBP1b-binding outer membrane lipoprotein LpoB